MNTVEKQKKDPYEPNYLMNKTEVRLLFQEKLNIGRTTYNQCFRPQLKFLSHGVIKGRVLRIPYRIVKGFLNRIARNPQPGDPSVKELQVFQENPHEKPENWQK